MIEPWLASSHLYKSKNDIAQNGLPVACYPLPFPPGRTNDARGAHRGKTVQRYRGRQKGREGRERTGRFDLCRGRGEKYRSASHVALCQSGQCHGFSPQIPIFQDWRIWLEKDGCPASFWHDVPLYPDESNKQVINFVVEIPRWTNGKIEIARDEPFSNYIFESRPRQLFHPADHLPYAENRHQIPSSTIPVKERPDSSRTSGRMSPTPFSTARSRKPGKVPTLNIPLLDSKGITIRSTCSISGRSEWGTRFQGREATALIDNRRV